MLEHYQTVAHNRDRRMELMRAAPQAHKLLACRRSIAWFRERACPDRQGLIGSQNQPTGAAARDRESFFARKQRRHARRVVYSGALLDLPLVEVSRLYFVRNSGGGENGMSALAL
jgi:hypothetical protein